MLALVVLLAAGQIAAQSDSRPAPADSSGVLELSLEDAIRLGLAASPDIKRAELEMKLAELRKNVAEANTLGVSEVEREQARRAYANAEYNYQLQQVQTALRVESLYYAVLRAEDTLALRSKAVQLAQEQHQVALSQFQIGAISELRLREVAHEVRKAQYAEDAARNALTLAELNLKQELGLPIDVPIRLTETVDFVPQEVDLDAALAIAEERRFEIHRALQAVEAAQDAVARASAPNIPRVQRDEAIIALDIALVNLEAAYNTVRPSVIKAVYDLLAAEEAYYLAVEAEALARENHAWAEEQYYNYGLISLAELLTSQARLDEAQVAVVAAKYEYNIAWAEYLTAIGLGFDRWPSLIEDGTVTPSILGGSGAEQEAK